MARIVVTEFMDEDGVATLRDLDLLYDPQLVDKPDVLRAALADCHALVVRNRTQVRAPLLDCSPRLKVIGRLGVGLDNIDLAACAARGLPVLPATGTNDETVAEFVLGGLLVLLRNGAYHASSDVLAGHWPRTRVIGRDAKGLRLGLLGFGAIARQVARRARVLGMTVQAFDPFVPVRDPAWLELSVQRCDLHALLAQSDVLSIHVPLTADTRNLIEAGALAAMPRASYLINTSRGGVVEEQALVAALRSGQLAGAMLDVMENEPLPANSRFVDVPNLLLSPHVAGITREANQRASLLTASNVLRVLRGETPTVADAAAAASKGA